jgi:hypothetical protein
MHPKHQVSSFWKSTWISFCGFAKGIWYKIKHACGRGKEVLGSQYKTVHQKAKYALERVRLRLVDMGEQLKRFVRPQHTAERT